MWRSKSFVFVLFVASLASSSAQDVENRNTSDRSVYKKSLGIDCDRSYSAKCLKLDIVSWVDKLNENENYSVFPGVSIVQEDGSARANTADIVSDLAREFPNDPDARLDAFLLKKVHGYLNSHAIKLNLVDADSTVSARKGGGGGGKKGGGGMGMILAAAAMMKGTLMALALGALAALAGKALMTGLISLLLSAIIGLKSLSGGGAHEDYHHGGGHSGYGRSFDMPLPLGLQPEYKPE